MQSAQLLGYGFAAAGQPAEELDECLDGQYFTVYDEADPSQVVFTTSRCVNLGDEYQTSDDRLFAVVRVEGNQAYARFISQVELSELGADFADLLSSLASGLAAAPAKKGNVSVGIYHSHSDESYTPTDGTSSIRGDGGIYKVGNAMARSLEASGVKVIHSQNKHDPHDAGAYQRSRRTAAALLKQRPTALVDVHRDAVPPSEYNATVNGEKVAQVQLVVGRQNPNMAANKQFAQEIKAATDKQQPGLVKGIFFARGGYNQDLHPRNILLEVGTDKHPRAAAEKGISLFAKSFANYLGASAAGSQAGQREGWVGSRAAGWLVALAIIGGGLFLWLSTGSWEELSSKLRTFATREFTNALGWGRRRRRQSDEDGDQQDT